jgi:hypothetical protein
MLCSHRLKIAILNEEIEHLKSKPPYYFNFTFKATIATLQARVKELEVEEKNLDKQEKN